MNVFSSPTRELADSPDGAGTPDMPVRQQGSCDALPDFPNTAVTAYPVQEACCQCREENGPEGDGQGPADEQADSSDSGSSRYQGRHESRQDKVAAGTPAGPRLRDLRLSAAKSELKVRVASFLIDNNLFYRLNPHLVASAEQLAFMVALDADQLYVPCSDHVFFDLMETELTPTIRREYARAWRICVLLLNSLDVDSDYKRSILAFCRQRLRRALLFHDIIPSRLVKRLTAFVLSPDTSLTDPWRERRRAENARAHALLSQADFAALCDRAPMALVRGASAATCSGLQTALDRTRLARHIAISLQSPAELMEKGAAVLEDFAAAETALAAVWERVPALLDTHSTILLLADASGCYFDLALAGFLVERGHRVIYAVKEEFYFAAPTLQDMFTDPVLQQALKKAYLCTDAAISKNGLLKLLREWGLIVISDGTRERLNLVRVSVTFSRAWKEADLILARGTRLYDTLFGTSHEFTRDILCWENANGSLRLHYRPHAKSVRKYSERDIMALSDGIIAHMREAQNEGRPIIFYSCVIGSIPGQTATAVRLATAIVEELQSRLPRACIINPATHFVEGMDGDDLMYMWERVQRSGLINIWYFQTADDIERGFRLLGESMPREWIGKDATYSTGCTKEMQIALEVQKSNPEMQIRGPDPDTFFRRGEYGVGKYFDATLVRR